MLYVRYFFVIKIFNINKAKIGVKIEKYFSNAV